ncbi:hypothetical protein R3P38DRAFT_491769 [Favolaschia claudopus]|uniref:G protein-coupled receptor n=1 Tax=Favolaschia claudopus TaxID=2862362 RepID=A0AAW0CN61_9AGAR
MADVQAHTARLIALFVSCVLYGILLTTFVPCLRSLLFSASQKSQFRPRDEIKMPIVAATIAMFFVSTFSAVIAMQDVLDAFINYHGPGGALEFYGNLHTLNNGWTHWMPAVEDSAQVILGDGLLVYRCYVLYNRNWRVIAAPSIAWVTLVAVSITASYREITLKGGQSLNDPSVQPIISAALILSFAISVMTTYLIIRKLLKTEFNLISCCATRPHILRQIARIFFETGLIYTLSLVVSFAIYLVSSNLQYVISLALINIIPITCNLLLIRVGGINHADQRLAPGSHNAALTAQKFNPKAVEEV